MIPQEEKADLAIRGEMSVKFRVQSLKSIHALLNSEL